MIRFAPLLLAAAALPLVAQEFEVASVKPSPPQTGDTMTTRMGGDRAIQTFTNVSLHSLITFAYSLKDYQLDGPDWLRDTRFDVIGKMPAGSSEKQAPAMMRKVLADRFHLVVHRETRALPAYALLVDKGGIKTGDPDPKDAPKEEADGTVSMRGSAAGPNMVDFPGNEMSTDSVAVLLSAALDRPVLDRTGLTGGYRFKMQWHESEDLSLFVALRKSVGLRLESIKAPIEVVIVDSVEKLPVVN